MWRGDRVSFLCFELEDSYESYDANIDLDDILDLDEESERIDYINVSINIVCFYLLEYIGLAQISMNVVHPYY